MRNDNKTWPAGKVAVYRDGLLVGEDGIEWTPRGRKAKITVGAAPDIDVKKLTTSKVREDRSCCDYDHSVVLLLKNYKDEAVTVSLLDGFPQQAKDLEASVAYQEQPGNLMTWNVTLAPGEKREIAYTYWTD